MCAEKIQERVYATQKRRKFCGKFPFWIFIFVILAVGFCMIPIPVKAYFGKNEDYLLRMQKPENRESGHYLEFVNGDERTHTVETGDTLWGIARKYYGNGLEYEKIWENNKDLIDSPETLQIGTKLKVPECLYLSAGMEDYVDSDVLRDHMLTGPDPWEGELSGYQIFESVPYRNDLQEADPYENWETFRKEVTECSQRLCGDRVSALGFARYQVTDVGKMCHYSFIFDGGKKQYAVMACFAYTDTVKSEAFAVCDLDECSAQDLEEAKGKVFYAVMRYLDPGIFYVKMADYIGRDDWAYPQLRNPFTQAMRSLYDGPLMQVEDFSNDYEIIWEDPVFEELVRDRLASLWQLTDAQREAFQKRPMTAKDLAAVESLNLYVDQEQEEVFLQLNSYEENRVAVLFDREQSSGKSQCELTTLVDLKNFSSLKRVDLHLTASPITDFSALGELAGLRELCLELRGTEARLTQDDLAFLGNLKELRLFYLFGREYPHDVWGGLVPAWAFDQITDLSVLRNCPHLAYLKLYTGNVESYDFLKYLPEMYYIDLSGRSDTKNVEPDEALLPNACFIEFYGEQVRFDTG